MPETSKENAVTILERAKLENWVLGTTKVTQIIFLSQMQVKAISISNVGATCLMLFMPVVDP